MMESATAPDPAAQGGAGPEPSLPPPQITTGLRGVARTVGVGLRRHFWRSLAALAVLSVLLLSGFVAFAHLWAFYHFRAAKADLERYHNGDATKHLDQCMKVWRQDPAVLCLAARCARRLGEFEAAEQFLDRYQKLRGKNNDDDLVLERILLRAERGELDDVAKFSKTLYDQDHPNSRLATEAMAHGYLRMFRLQEAEFVLHLWLEREPENVQAHMFVGMLQELREASPDAAATYLKVLQLDPELDEARQRRSRLFVDMGLGGEAIPHLEYLLAKKPDNLECTVLLARSLDQQARTTEAERLLDELLAKVPDFPPALVERAKLAMRSEQYALAESLLRRAIVNQPGDYQMQYQLYLCLLRGGKADEAAKVQAKIKQIEDDNTRLQEIIGVKMQRSPHDPALHYEAGMIALHAGSVKDGLRWLLSAHREDPNHGPTNLALADFYQRVGQIGKASRHRELAKRAGATASDSKALVEEKKR